MYNITTNHHSHRLIPYNDLPESVKSDFDYVAEGDRFLDRFVRYNKFWYDVNQFTRIVREGDKIGFEYGTSDPNLLKWDGICIEDVWTSIVAKLVQDGSDGGENAIMGTIK